MAKPYGPSDTYTPLPGPAAGVLVEAQAFGLMGLETGAVYMYPRYKTILKERNDDDAELEFGYTFRETRVMVPLLLRISFGHAFSIAGGGYYSQGLGTISMVKTGGTGSVVEGKDVSYADRKIKASDYGWMASLGIDISWTKWIFVVFDLRYSRSLSDGNTNSSTTKPWYYHQYQAYGGLEFRLFQDPDS